MSGNMCPPKGLDIMQFNMGKINSLLKVYNTPKAGIELN